MNCVMSSRVAPPGCTAERYPSLTLHVSRWVGKARKKLKSTARLPWDHNVAAAARPLVPPTVFLVLLVLQPRHDRRRAERIPVIAEEAVERLQLEVLCANMSSGLDDLEDGVVAVRCQEEDALATGLGKKAERSSDEALLGRRGARRPAQLKAQVQHVLAVRPKAQGEPAWTMYQKTLR